MAKIVFLTFIAWILSMVSYGQDTIPFRVTEHRNIIVKSLVNDQDSLDLMFQIAMTNASLSPESDEKAKSILFDTTAYKDGVSKNNTLRAGSIERKEILFFGNEITGHGADGKIGTVLFEGKPFKIDYDHGQFVVYDTIPDTVGFTSIPVQLGKEQIFVPAYSRVDGELIQHHFFLQSGFSGTILYDDDFSEQHELDNKLTFVSEKTLRNSRGQHVTTKQGFVDQLDIDGFTLKYVPVGLFLGEIKIQKFSYAGADIMHRFNWIIDPARKVAYIQKSKFFDTPYYPMG